MHINPRRHFLLFTILVLLCTFAIGAQAQTITSQYLYVSGVASSSTQGRIAGYRIGADGSLTQTQGAFPTSETVIQTLPSAFGAKLFALGLHKLWVFSVNPSTGTISLLSSVVFPQNIGGNFMALNPASTLLFVSKTVDSGTQNFTTRITTYKIGSTGVLTAVASSVVNGLLPSLSVDNTGRFLYATIGNPDITFSVQRFSINSSTGALTFAGTSALGTQPASMAIHPNNNFLYVGLNVPEVQAFSRNVTTGALTHIGDAFCGCDAGPDFGNGIAINPHGTVLLEATGQDAGIAVYTINQTTGLLTPQGGSFIPLVFGPVPFTVDHANGFIYAIDMQNSKINGYQITDAGVATPTAQGSVPFPADINPQATLQVLAVKK
jgi:6-phosphogluconolactonase (cycloisomerase 2 family)